MKWHLEESQVMTFLSITVKEIGRMIIIILFDLENKTEENGLARVISLPHPPLTFSLNGFPPHFIT